MEVALKCYHVLKLGSSKFCTLETATSILVDCIADHESHLVEYKLEQNRKYRDVFVDWADCHALSGDVKLNLVHRVLKEIVNNLPSEH